jgi:hypothetical protein
MNKTAIIINNKRFAASLKLQVLSVLVIIILVDLIT